MEIVDVVLNLQLGWQNMGFVFLNRYLDIVEAIDDEDASTIDNVNFETSDIPQDFPVPESHFLGGTGLL